MKNTIREERIAKLRDKLTRIETALKNYPYKNHKDILEDLFAFEETEKEIQIQQAYWLMES